MTHKEILAGIDEEILRLQGIRAVLDTESNGFAGTSESQEHRGAAGDHIATPLQSIFAQSPKQVMEDTHTRAVAQQREISAKWSLY